MKRLLKHLDKWLLALCVLGFLGSAVLAVLRLNRVDEIAARSPAVGVRPIALESKPLQHPQIETAFWPDAEAQSRGSKWVYDVFTPPVIYYNRETREFTVTPPDLSERVVEKDTSPFQVELVAVRQEPYRIQLVGYVGTEGEPLGTFEDMESGATFVGRQGRTYDDEQFSIESFDIRKVTTNARESMPVVETIGIAVIVDGRTGREETLTTQERKMLPRLQAVLRVLDGQRDVRVVREGAAVVVNGYSYLVTQLSLNPPQAVVSRRAPDSLGSLETRTLTPASPTNSSANSHVSPPSGIFSFSTP